MEDKIKELINFYTVKMERKQRLLEPYLEKNNNDLNMTEVEYARMEVYRAEINLIKQFIEKLEDL